MRDCDLPPVCAGLAEMDQKELFIAQGNVKGVENENLMKTILREVIVLCTAKVEENTQSFPQLVDVAQYFFNRVDDGNQGKLLKIDKIYKLLGALAPKLYNKPEWI